MGVEEDTDGVAEGVSVGLTEGVKMASTGARFHDEWSLPFTAPTQKL